jgi:hypothetical protein
VLHSQRHHAEEVVSALVADAQDGFPVAHYPLSLQKADEYAQVAGFDRDLLTELMKDAIRERLPSGRGFVLDAMQLEVDVTARRYG